MCAEPISALALCVLPYGPEKLVENDLTQLLAGVCSILKDENCALVGGHTSEGTDLAVGLSVNGYVLQGKETQKGPPRNGDVLILTKPLGTGVILAADMRGEAKGEWVAEAISNMLQSNKHCAILLRDEFNCSGSDLSFIFVTALRCTDVTGFGLMGHLLEMMKSGRSSDEDFEEDIESDICVRPKKSLEIEGLEATLCLRNIPLLNGAVECVGFGVLSSLHPQVESFLLSLDFSCRMFVVREPL
jgi:selenide,water dikinase